MTLMRPTVKVENISTACDQSGRVLIVNLTIKDEEWRSHIFLFVFLSGLPKQRGKEK